MKVKPKTTQELETELRLLTEMVRDRRKELARLQTCPNKSCQCRVVWREQVEKNMASQVRKIRRKLNSNSAKVLKNTKTARKKP